MRGQYWLWLWLLLWRWWVMAVVMAVMAVVMAAAVVVVVAVVGGGGVWPISRCRRLSIDTTRPVACFDHHGCTDAAMNYNEITNDMQC